MRKRLEKNIKETVLPCYEVAHAEKSSLFFSQSSLAERRIPHFLKKRVSDSSLRSKESSTKSRTRYPQACFYINFVYKLALRARDTFVIQNK